MTSHIFSESIVKFFIGNNSQYLFTVFKLNHYYCSAVNLFQVYDNCPTLRSKMWSKGLLKEMKENNVYEDSDIAIIKDKFPKAKQHFLVLPKMDITNFDGLNKSHVHLLKTMESKGLEVARETCDAELNFRVGYHAIPSMERVHLHVISDDFIATGLKTKKHWNSYTTEFFIPSSEFINQLKTNGQISIQKERYKDMLLRPLKCHKCQYMPRTMPDLKEHLNRHFTTNNHS